MESILPPQASAPPARPPWSGLHERLHRHLRRDPALLPPGAALLVAVSGGQDSMALTRLLLDLRRLHHWRLHLWHGDHGWRAESGRQAEELAAWAAAQGLAITVERAGATGGAAPLAGATEAAARQWRYGRLARLAASLDCPRVVTAHTASDRAETLVLHLARGSHRRGLTSLRPRRPLEPGSPRELVRPLLGFCRDDTAALCAHWDLPIWPDPSNDTLQWSRNRVRHQVLPVLEQLHPGASRRISALAARLQQEQEPLEELLPLALAQLCHPDDPDGLDLKRLTALRPASRRQLLRHWLAERAQIELGAGSLEQLVQRLQPHCGAGIHDLGRGRRLVWGAGAIRLSKAPPPGPSGPSTP
ncbi:tRNA lysidine(34) synthetase TilS [Vulcanococcus limneticus]|uniref:tRNA lysidine(34) synthetase TilS n=1 Tax=Vulcanococcus limneticus TaxID=2170428 RepID=UPI00398BE156